jgi:hypothetical protein
MSQMEYDIDQEFDTMLQNKTNEFIDCWMIVHDDEEVVKCIKE